MPLAFSFLLMTWLQVAANEPNHLFEAGATWDHFLDRVDRQRELWLRISSEATVSAEMVERVRRAGRDLQLLVVAEDWCPDSAYSVPYVARLAALAQVPMRVVDRQQGSRQCALIEHLMDELRRPRWSCFVTAQTLARG